MELTMSIVGGILELYGFSVSKWIKIWIQTESDLLIRINEMCEQLLTPPNKPQTLRHSLYGNEVFLCKTPYGESQVKKMLVGFHNSIWQTVILL